MNLGLLYVGAVLTGAVMAAVGCLWGGARGR